MRKSINIKLGLTNEQVEERIKNNQTNNVKPLKNKSVQSIILKNTFTLFNILNFSIAFAIFYVQSYQNLLFLGVVLSNLIITSWQEIKAKKIIDKLSITNKNPITVIRNQNSMKIKSEQIVIDDIISYKIGDQVVTDAYIKKGNVTVDESSITGEINHINYKENDFLKSGSYIISGTCLVQVEHIKLDNFTSQLVNQTNQIKEINSVLLISFQKIIKNISLVIIPLGILLFYNQYNLNQNLKASILSTTTSLISMIPEGLILLTSTVLTITSYKLAKNNILIQELYCIENLARIDTICFDKTGTLTTKKLNLVETIILDDKKKISEIIGNILNIQGIENETTKALTEKYPICYNYQFITKIPFSSQTKHSVTTFKEGNFKLGAPEYISNQKFNNKKRTILLTENDKPIAYFILEDKLKPNIKNTFNYLIKNDINIKIITGDNAIVAEEIAKNTGLINIKVVDLNEKHFTEKIILENNVYARANPLQKKQIIKILQNNNHIVAMAGDGINDVLALKQANCSISFKDASDVARNISQIILLDSNFKSLEKIITEGKKTINNIQTNATLFITKNVTFILLSIIFIFVNINYPYQPIQITLTNTFTIGIPALILSFENNNNSLNNNFLKTIFKNVIPTSLTSLLTIIVIFIVANNLKIPFEIISTYAVINFAYIGYMQLIKINYPFTKNSKLLIMVLPIAFLLTIILLGDIFFLKKLNVYYLMILLSIISLSTLIYIVINKIFTKKINFH